MPLAQGDLAAALISFQAEFLILDRLAKSDGGNAGWQHDLAMSYEKIGAVQKARGDLPAALISFEAEFAILDRLTKSDASYAGWQADLSNSYDWIGDVQRAQGDPSAARPIRRVLPSETAWRSPMPATPAGSAASWSHTTKSATCSLSWAICRQR